MIPFNVPPLYGTEERYVREAINSHKICGDGAFTKKCDAWIEEKTGTAKALLTTSGSSALDLAALLCDVSAGDEVIMSSFTFSSTANAFALRGASIVFTDIRPDTMNINEKLIEEAVTSRTKAIVPMHYAGVACEMDEICAIAKRHGLMVVEDAAQAVMSQYKGRMLGAIGDIGCYSFHETKNYSMGEGGAILLSDASFAERAEILREKGTDRSKFLRGQIDKYSWVDIGSSFLPSEMNAAYLYAQFEAADAINENRLKSWDIYYEALKPLEEKGYIELPFVPEGCVHNAHMFYIKAKDITERTELIEYLKQNEVGAVFHYIPLHSAPAGRRFGRFAGEDKYTTKESERLLRLPMYYGLDKADAAHTCEAISAFYTK